MQLERTVILEGEPINPTNPVRPAKPRRSWLGLIVLLGFVGALITVIWLVSKSRISGEAAFTVEGTSWTMHPDSCRSGARRQYFGASFFDHKQPGMGGRVVLPESGEPHIALNVPNADYAVNYNKSDCTVWDVNLENTGGRYNGIRAVGGHARWDCSTDSSPVSHSTGNLQFGQCN